TKHLRFDQAHAKRSTKHLRFDLRFNQAQSTKHLRFDQAHAKRSTKHPRFDFDSSKQRRPS
ncbi:MAG: hypothetical protein NTX48_04720, partial [Planctomycetales bacterium]|nr:hypothetical protein [Planctomycetales bacterium]